MKSTLPNSIWIVSLLAVLAMPVRLLAQGPAATQEQEEGPSANTGERRAIFAKFNAPGASAGSAISPAGTTTEYYIDASDLYHGLPAGRDDRQNGITFEINGHFGSILIRAQVNGHPATLVVDTGSSHTILSSELVQVRTLALERADAPAKGSGLVGSAGWAKAAVEVGTSTWPDRRVLVMNDFQELSASMKQRVDGILGEDVLKEFNSVVIDFKHHRLVLLH